MKKMRLPNPVATRVVNNRLTLGSVYTAKQMRKFAEKAVLLEREACAQVCEGRNRDGDWFAAEIRARGQG